MTDRRPWPKLRRGDGRGILIALAVLVIVALIVIRTPAKPPVATPGFGPEWKCLDPRRGQICVKLPPEH